MKLVGKKITGFILNTTLITACYQSCSSPLVGAQAAVCRGQQRLQVRGKFVQLHGKGGEAVVEEVILWLGICGETQACSFTSLLSLYLRL